MNTEYISCFSIAVIKIPRRLTEGSLFGLVVLKGWSPSVVAMAAEAGWEGSRLDPQTRSREKEVEMTQAP